MWGPEPTITPSWCILANNQQQLTAYPQLTVAIIAVEPSGDLHGGNLVKALRAINPNLKFVGVGGSHMAASGVKLWLTTTDMAIIGPGGALLCLHKCIYHYLYVRSHLLKAKPHLTILIDCPAGIEQGFKNAIAGADRALVVTTAEISAIRDADRIIGLLATSQIKNPELIINRIRPNMIKRGEMMDVEDIVELLSIDLIGVIPDDEYIITQTNKGEPAVINKKAPSGRAYVEIARRILGESIDVTIPGKDEKFLDKIKNVFRKK